eukprot:8575044-Pyramimonas_sp.AAC.1
MFLEAGTSVSIYLDRPRILGAGARRVDAELLESDPGGDRDSRDLYCGPERVDGAPLTATPCLAAEAL